MGMRRQQKRLLRQQEELNRRETEENNLRIAEELADRSRLRLSMVRRNFGIASLVRGSLRGFR